MSIKIEGELECKYKNRRVKENAIIIERNRKENGTFIEDNLVKIE